MTCSFKYQTKLCYVRLDDRDYIDTARIRSAIKVDNCELLHYKVHI